LPSTTITVVIPVRNRAHCIGRALSSVVGQSLPVDEILVVDDGSEDDLGLALAPYADNVRLLRHGEARGAAAARNTGIAEARGDLIAFLDSDDLWAPRKLEHQLGFMQRHGFAASCTGFGFFPAAVPEQSRTAFRPYGESLDIADMAWGCYVAPGSTLVCSRQSLLEFGGYDIALPRYEDWDLLLRMLMPAGTRLGFITEPLAQIETGIHYRAADVELSLGLIAERHGPALQHNYRLGRRFHSGIAFNRAALRRAQGDHVGTAAGLARSMLLQPFDNWPIRNVLLGKLRTACFVHDDRPSSGEAIVRLADGA
jgi:glycosyltransferase involved in cell wall biosynthesis